jgi:hypothetical protein
MYRTRTPRNRTSLSKGHLAGMASTHRLASSGVQDFGSIQGRLNFGSELVKTPHHRGGRVRGLLDILVGFLEIPVSGEGIPTIVYILRAVY